MLDCHGAHGFDVQFILANDGNPWIVNYQCILNKVDGLILLLWLLLTLLPRFMSKTGFQCSLTATRVKLWKDIRTKWERWTSARLGIWRKEQRKLKWIWLYVRTWVAFSKTAWNGWYLFQSSVLLLEYETEVQIQMFDMSLPPSQGSCNWSWEGDLRQEGLRYISLPVIAIKCVSFLNIGSIDLHTRLIICDTPPKRTHSLPLQDADSPSGKGKALNFFLQEYSFIQTPYLKEKVSVIGHSSTTTQRIVFYSQRRRAPLRRVNLIGFPSGAGTNAALVFYSVAVFLIEQWYNYLWHSGWAQCGDAEPASMLSGLTTCIKMRRGGRLLANYLVCEHNYNVGAQRLKLTVEDVRHSANHFHTLQLGHTHHQLIKKSTYVTHQSALITARLKTNSVARDTK